MDRLYIFVMLIAASVLMPRSVAGSNFDGTYTGTIHLVGKDNNPQCLTTPSVQMVIADGKLVYRHFGNLAIFELPLHDEGSFSGSAFNQYNKQIQLLKGSVLGNRVEAETENPYCKNHLTLERK